MFSDRSEAGRQLAQALQDLRSQADRIVVLAIPRGGVIVGREIADRLQVPLDICLTHKIGAPDNPELAIGAVAEDGTALLDRRLIEMLGIPRQHIQAEIDRWRQELTRRAQVYRGPRQRVPLKDRIVVVVDDGVATGSTLIAALRSVRQAGARILIAAVPVGPLNITQQLRQEADRVVMLEKPFEFWAVGLHYQHFEQVSDQDVIEALRGSPA
jgi:putative phosphoribosyl transferase